MNLNLKPDDIKEVIALLEEAKREIWHCTCTDQSEILESALFVESRINQALCALTGIPLDEIEDG